MRCHTTQTAAHAHPKGHTSQPAGTYPQDPHAPTDTQCGVGRRGRATVPAAAVTLVVLPEETRLAVSGSLRELGNGAAALAPSAPTAWLSAANDAAIPGLGYLTKWQLSPLRNDQPECTRSRASSPHLTPIRAMWAFRPHEPVPVPLAVPVGPPPFSQNRRRHTHEPPPTHSNAARLPLRLQRILPSSHSHRPAKSRDANQCYGDLKSQTRTRTWDFLNDTDVTEKVRNPRSPKHKQIHSAHALPDGLLLVHPRPPVQSTHPPGDCHYLWSSPEPPSSPGSRAQAPRGR